MFVEQDRPRILGALSLGRTVTCALPVVPFSLDPGAAQTVCIVRRQLKDPSGGVTMSVTPSHVGGGVSQLHQESSPGLAGLEHK